MASGPYPQRTIRVSSPELDRECPAAYWSTSVTSAPRTRRWWAVHAPNTPAPTTTTRMSEVYAESRTIRGVAVLQDLLAARTHDAAPELVEQLDGGSTGRPRVRCYACGHRCPIPDGAMGVCKVRFN